MVRLTWRGKETYENGDVIFQPGESRLYESMDDIAAELLMNHAFSVSEVDTHSQIHRGPAAGRRSGVASGA